MYTSAVVTLSDKGSIGEREHLSGKKIIEVLKQYGYTVKDYTILPDDIETIKSKLIELCDKNINLIITTGGTGFSKRDVTPEATIAVCDRMANGISEAIRSYSLTITKRAMLSRGVSGIRKNSVIINLPGSLKAVTESLDVFMDTIGHGIGVLVGKDKECGNIK